MAKAFYKRSHNPVVSNPKLAFAVQYLAYALALGLLIYAAVKIL